MDSDPVWVGNTRKQTHDEGNTHLRFMYADVGEIVVYGNPKDPTLRKIQHDYQVKYEMN